MTDNTVKFWDRIARGSTKDTSELQGTSLKTIEETLPFLKPEDHVLDFGCGMGDLSMGLARDVTAVTAIDTSSGMIQVAQSRAKQAGIPNITFRQMSIEQLVSSNQQFDVVTVFNVLHHIQDVPKLVDQINQLLPFGGLFISATACLSEKRGVAWAGLKLLIGLKLLPKMQLIQKKALETHIIDGGFRLMKKEELTSLPEYFLVARKVS